MLETTLDLELGKRLERVYKLSRRPETLVELQALFREKRNNPAVEVYLERVRSGAGVIGASSGPTPYRNVLAEGDVDVMCGYDALMNALLRGAGVVQASCVHCGEAMEFDLRDHDTHPAIRPRAAVSGSVPAPSERRETRCAITFTCSPTGRT